MQIPFKSICKNLCTNGPTNQNSQLWLGGSKLHRKLWFFYLYYLVLCSWIKKLNEWNFFTQFLKSSSFCSRLLKEPRLRGYDPVGEVADVFDQCAADQTSLLQAGWISGACFLKFLERGLSVGRFAYSMDKFLLERFNEIHFRLVSDQVV